MYSASTPHPSGAMKLESMDRLYRIHEGGYRTRYAIREQNLLVLSIKREIRINRRLGF